jgi:hypothetical protein
VILASPAVALVEVAGLGDKLSIVIVADAVSVPACACVPVHPVTVPVTAKLAPGTTGILAWVFGVILTLNIVGVVVTAREHPVNDRVKLAGLVISVQASTFAFVVSSTKLMLLKELAGARVTVMAVTVSVPTEVVNVKASRSVTAVPGATVELPGLVPSARVVTVGVKGPLGIVVPAS